MNQQALLQMAFVFFPALVLVMLFIALMRLDKRRKGFSGYVDAVVSLNPNGRLHSVTGPSVVFEDGKTLYYVNGIQWSEAKWRDRFGPLVLTDRVPDDPSDGLDGACPVQ